MKKEYNFSKAERGKFHNADGELNLPIYLDPENEEFIARLSAERMVDRSQVVNKLLKIDREIIEL